MNVYVGSLRRLSNGLRGLAISSCFGVGSQIVRVDGLLSMKCFFAGTLSRTIGFLAGSSITSRNHGWSWVRFSR